MLAPREAADAEAEDTLKALKACDLDALLSTVRVLVRQRDELVIEKARSATTRIIPPSLGSRAATAKAVLEDLVDLLERSQRAANEEAGSVPGVRLSPSVLKHQRQFLWGLAWDAVLELVNSVGDVLFFLLVLPPYPTLYWWSLVALCLSLVGRGAIALSSWGRVDPQLRGWFWLGFCLSLVEPVTGGRVLRQSFNECDDTGGVTAAGGVVRKDPQAIAAANEYAASRAEIRNSVLLVALEDVNALVIEVWFLSLQGSGLDFGSVGALFYLTTAGTLMHMVRQISEILALRSALPHLLEMMTQRDKAFGEDTTDEQLHEFARQSCLAARRCDARLCSGSITDRGVQAVARHCPVLDSLDLGTNRGVDSLSGRGQLTDATLCSIGASCPVLTKIFLTDCAEWVTDIGVTAIAEGCPMLTKFSVRKCSQITDVGIVAISQRCHSLRLAMLNDVSLTQLQPESILLR